MRLVVGAFIGRIWCCCVRCCGLIGIRIGRKMLLNLVWRSVIVDFLFFAKHCCYYCPMYYFD